MGTGRTLTGLSFSLPCSQLPLFALATCEQYLAAELVDDGRKVNGAEDVVQLYVPGHRAQDQVRVVDHATNLIRQACR